MQEAKRLWLPAANLEGAGDLVISGEHLREAQHARKAMAAFF